MTKNITDILRPFLVVLFIFGFGSLTACGGGGGNTAASVSTPTTVTVGMVTVTLPAPPAMTITTEIPAPNPASVPLAFDDSNLGALYYRGFFERRWLGVISLAAGETDITLFGDAITLARMSITHINYIATNPGFLLPELTVHSNGYIVPVVDNSGTIVIMPSNTFRGGFQTRPGITTLLQLCDVPWLVSYINDNFGSRNCPGASQLSYSPNMPNVLHAAMADTFHRGIGIGESRFAFSGRHNGNDRAAGFTYDFDNFALRTDYIRLPSKQDGGVWLDTYRFGILQPINDEARFFAGVDSYKNAILALDINAKNQHRFGIAAGNGYAVKYELRVRL